MPGQLMHASCHCRIIILFHSCYCQIMLTMVISGPPGPTQTTDIAITQKVLYWLELGCFRGHLFYNDSVYSVKSFREPISSLHEGREIWTVKWAYIIYHIHLSSLFLTSSPLPRYFCFYHLEMFSWEDHYLRFLVWLGWYKMLLISNE